MNSAKQTADLSKSDALALASILREGIRNATAQGKGDARAHLEARLAQLSTRYAGV